jgi:ribonuclease BN (tRNA processing enzyme)
MTSRIIFLGTGGDIFAVGKQLRASGGIVIEAAGSQFFIDPGPGALNKAKEYGINVRKTIGLIVTHAHMNHSNDANAVISAMTQSGMDKSGVLVANKTAFNGDENHDPVISRFHKGCVERSMTIEPGQRIGINQVDIEALKAKHDDPFTVGLKFITPEFTLVYSSDTGYSEEIQEQYKDADILILNVVNPAGIQNENLLNADDAIEIIKNAKPKLAIITHFGIKMLNADPVNEVREMQKKTSIETLAAQDGMIVNPLSYTAIIAHGSATQQETRQNNLWSGKA